MVAWMRSPVACAAVVSPKPVADGVGIAVEAASDVERVSVVPDVGEGNAVGGGEAAEHPKISASRTVVAVQEVRFFIRYPAISLWNGYGESPRGWWF